MKLPGVGTGLLTLGVSLLFAQSAAAQNSAVALRITAAVDDAKRVRLTGNIHPLAQARFDQGAAPDSLPLERLLLILKRSPEQEAALRTLLDEQQDRSSPNYHKWVTPVEFGRRFGPSDADIQIVKGWLEGHGFRVGNVANGKSVIEFSGTVALVRQAFRTEIHKFVANGESHWANTSEPEIPEAIAPVVDGIKSLHSFFKKPMHVLVKDDAKFAVRPGSHPDYNLGNGSHALTPGDFATIYNVNPVYTAGTTGAGWTIAVLGRSNINLMDVIQFRQLTGLPENTPTVVLNGSDPGKLGDGDENEALLDTEWAGGVGRGATVKFVLSQSTETVDGVDLSGLYTVDNDLADIMSESFSLCEALLNNDINNSQLKFELNNAEQAAAEGITFTADTGDSGAASCDSPGESSAQGPVSVGVPASTPYTIAVGGTQFDENGDDPLYWSASNNADNSSVLQYIPEEAWNQSCAVAQCGSSANLAAGGGGASAVFSKPAFQTGVAGIPADGHRDVPDISFSAATRDGYVICRAGKCGGTNPAFSVVGGTSAPTPAFAGVMSLITQKTNSRQGQADFALYHLAASETFANCNASTLEPGSPPASNCIFNDVTVGNNSVPGATGFSAGTGYDQATGLGSANVQNLVNNWASAVGTATTTTLTINPASIMHGASVTASGTVTGSGGTPTGEISFLADGQSLAGVGLDSLSGGAYSAPITDLPGGGPYGVVAHYAGDTQFAESTSNTVQVTVTPEASTVTVSARLVNASQQTFTVIPQNGSVPPGSLVFVRADVAGNSGHGIPTGTVTLTDAQESDGATLTLNSDGFAEIQSSSLSNGNHSFSATYSGDVSFDAGGSTTSANFSIGSSANPAFSVSANPATQTIAAGSHAQSTVTVSGSGGFAGTVSLSQSVSGPPGATEPAACSFSAASVALSSATTSGTSTLTCTTMSASQVLYLPDSRLIRPLWLAILAAVMIVSIFSFARPARKHRWAAALVLIAIGSAGVVAGCGGGGASGGGGGNPGTTAGTYTVTVTATSSSSHTTTFTITVQ